MTEDNTVPELDSETIKKLTNEFSEALQETNPDAVAQVKRMIERIGEASTREFVKEAQAIHAGDGMMTRDNSRKRTLGGIFFYQARGKIKSWKNKSYIWPHLYPLPSKFEWNDRLEIVPKLQAEKGTIEKVKISIVGRPGKVVTKGRVVLTSMQNETIPTLPKGLPQPPKDPTNYIVFITEKQWNRISESIADPEDRLIVDGYAAFDKRLKSMVIFALRTTTTLTEESRRAKQRATVEA